MDTSTSPKHSVYEVQYLVPYIYRVGGAMIGSMICFRVSDTLGRRGELLVASMLFFFGACIEYGSGVSTWSASFGISILLLGRIIYGLGCGFAMHGVRPELLLLSFFSLTLDSAP